MSDLAPMAGLTLLFKRDSVHVFWPEDVELDGNVLRVGRPRDKDVLRAGERCDE